MFAMASPGFVLLVNVAFHVETYLGRFVWAPAHHHSSYFFFWAPAHHHSSSATASPVLFPIAASFISRRAQKIPAKEPI